MNYYFNIGIGILLVAALVTTAYRYFKKVQQEKVNNEYVENKEFLKKAGSIQSELYFFYVDWCPHSKNAMKTWNQIKVDPNFQKFKVNFITIDCEDKSNKHLISEFDIKEYPSYVLNAKGKKYIYDANLNQDSLHRFLTSVYNKF
jgi:thiol-disulfide isomerase/thioredoxin